MQCFVYWLFQI